MPLIPIAAADALQRLDALRHHHRRALAESEFAEDRLPGAVNWPSLDDDERALVGTEYKQVSPFAAKKRGAALVARNVAGAHRAPRARQAARLDAAGLLLARRQAQRRARAGARPDRLSRPPARRRLPGVSARASSPRSKSCRHASIRVVCGPTGSGKSRLLRALAGHGAQVLDLEALANHRGSVLGLVPGSAPAAQKAFDTRVWNALAQLDPARPVFVESESKKVGDLRVPGR